MFEMESDSRRRCFGLLVPPHLRIIYGRLNKLPPLKIGMLVCKIFNDGQFDFSSNLLTEIIEIICDSLIWFLLDLLFSEPSIILY